jgi:1,4-alpha-glucan branching enzyme
MNDTLRFFQKDPIHRQHHLNDLTFSLIYAFTENFCLPLSHDEVVYGKQSLLNKMPGDEWQQFANLRLLFSEQFTHPGTKLIFQGGEFGQREEWNHSVSLDWHLTDYAPHKGIQETMKALNALYRDEPALHVKQFSHETFEWLESNDQGNSVISFVRKGETAKQQLIVILNLTPAPREDYRIGVPLPGVWKVVFNSDKGLFGGSDYPTKGAVMTEEYGWHGKAFSIALNLPPLSCLILKA